MVKVKGWITISNNEKCNFRNFAQAGGVAYLLKTLLRLH